MTASVGGPRQFLSSVRAAISRWYRGDVRVRVDSSPSLLVLGLDQRRHWTAALARVVVGFWVREWKWLTGFAVAVAGVVLGLKRL
jgi:hypothetical protein